MFENNTNQNQTANKFETAAVIEIQVADNEWVAVGNISMYVDKLTQVPALQSQLEEMTMLQSAFPDKVRIVKPKSKAEINTAFTL